MIRNTIMYRRLWYVKRRNAKRIRTYAILMIVLITMTILMSLIKNIFLPHIISICDMKIKNMIALAADHTVQDAFSQSISYNEIVTLNKDEKGDISSIQTDFTRLGKISSTISANIQKKINELGRDGLELPIGSLLAENMFKITGPNIHINLQSTEKIKVSFRSEFTRTANKQTRHRIILQIKAGIDILIPLAESKTVYYTEIPVMEAVITGNIPDIQLSS